ncbi:MAG: RluA family pseudouridine synthase [Endomicrobiia bacterium]
MIKIEENIKERVDKFLKEKFGEYSREYIKVLCKKGFIKVNNKITSSSDKVKFGDVIEIVFPERKDIYLNEQEDFETIFEDKNLLVINKPAGLLVHPGKKFDTRKTLLDILCEKYRKLTELCWELERPFLVHRLDKDTSGVMLIAKNPQTQYLLSKQFETRQIKKVYRAIVEGEVKVLSGEIIAPIEKTKNCVKIGDYGKQAKTKFKVISRTKKVSYLELYPETGRTHQIRIHTNFIGHPIVGDTEYGGSEKIELRKVDRPMLHSYKIKFIYPDTKKSEVEKWLEFCAKIPKDFQDILSFCGL